MALDAIILAAGKGTRMKSEKAKVLHPVMGRPMIQYVIDAVSGLGCRNIYLVVGHQADAVRAETEQTPNITYVLQSEQLGTGHAVMQADPFINRTPSDEVVILAGDCPLLSIDTLKHVQHAHQQAGAVATVLTTILPDAAQYGRILRTSSDQVIGIREAKDCTEDELKIKEINSGMFCFNTDILFKTLKRTQPNNNQNEYYLTDAIELLVQDGQPVTAYCTTQSSEVLGINSQEDLALVEKLVTQSSV